MITAFEDRRSPGVRDRRANLDDVRGRKADSPTEIPAKGWKDVLKRVKQDARDDNITLVAGGVAFFALLSAVPALVALVSIYGLAADPAEIPNRVNEFAGTMPEEARKLFIDQLTTVATADRSGLGFGLVLGVVIALWGASTAMKHLTVALSSMYQEQETRGYLKLRGIALLLTLGALLFAAVVIGAFALAPGPSDGPMGVVVSIARWPTLALVMMGGLAVLYHFAPDRDNAKWRWVSWGAAIATVLWLAASALFSLYAANFGSYNKTYGAMAGVVLLMLWLYITALCVLLGAEINAELEHQTAKDSTEGKPQPMGTRDAEMADTVGAPSD